MPDSATTIVAVLVAGVAGPGITALATTRGQRRRFKHERSVADIGDLRTLGTEAVTHIDTLDTIRTAALRRLFFTHGHANAAAFEDPMRKYADAVTDLNRVRAQLEIRLGPENEASRALYEIIRAHVSVANFIESTQALQQTPTADEAKLLTRDEDLEPEARTAFVRLMAELAGSRIQA